MHNVRDTKQTQITMQSTKQTQTHRAIKYYRLPITIHCMRVGVTLVWQCMEVLVKWPSRQSTEAASYRSSFHSLLLHCG